ncbi:MAG: fibronectin type III domain-containing protein, partial [Rhodothermaceae bacterium]|nr:fibronectin type III domain-containing protein [Rhodothermaceae bacterium]
MNYITNFFRVGCVALLAMLILAPGAFAQQDPPTEPNPPTDLEAVATDAAAGSIILTWSPVTGDDNGGFDVPLTAAGYQIEVSADYDAADPTAATWATVPSGEIAVTPAAPEADPAVPKFTAVHTLPTTDAGGEAIPTHNLTRHYRVSAINVIGTGDPSTVAMATTHNVPDPPTDLAAASSITITWSPIEAANNGGLPVALADGYVLEVTATPTVDDSWEASGSVTSGGSIAIVPADPDADPAVPKFTATHTLADADDGVTRHYRVKAVNAASTDGGEYSTAVSGTTHDVPDAPTGLAVGDVTVNSGTDTQNDIALSWNSVPDANNGGLAITGYNVEFLTDAAGADWADATAGTPVAHAAGTIETTHAGLDEQDPALTYYYRVRAVSAAGNGDWSSVTTGVKLAPPGAPTELTVTAVDQQEAIDLFWKAPENTGEPPVTSYRIERAVDYDGTQDPPTATWTVLQANYPGTGRAFRDRNLTNPADGTAYADGTTFTYQVTAINVVGAGDPSNADGAISSNKALAPRNLTATVADDMESIVLSWDGPVADEDNPANGGSPITGYKIEVSTDAGATWADVEEDKPEHPENELLTNVPGSEFTYTHMDVAAGTSYIYRVSAVNDAGPGHVSASSTSVSIDAGVPDAPTGLSAMAAADADGITLEWSAPAEIGGSDITSWKIEVSEDYDASDADAATWAELALTVTDPDDTAVPPTTTYSTVHTGLTPGATYTYRVSATNSAGTGDASDIASAVAPDIPGAPTGLTATADGENTINLSWTAPVVPTGASAITGYKIESSDDGTEDSWTDLVANTGNTDVEYADTGLDPATTRHYRVSAMNAAGSTGSASDPANATTADRGIVTRYAVSEDGATSGTCTDAANPCTLEAALSASGASDNDLILVRIRRAGETATIGDDTSIGKMVTLGVYVRGASAAAKGAVSFTGSVAMTDGGDLMTHKDASVHFDELEVSGMSSIDKLTVGDDLTISKDDEENAMTSVLAVDELTVNSGQTLTLGAGADVRVRLTKGAVGKMNGKLDVKGTVDGDGDLWIAHTTDERDDTDFMLHEPGDYDPYTAIPPSKNKFTVDDCLMVTGGGTVENDLHFVAAGNVCVNLGEIGDLVAVGSIAGQDDITTDVIFRNGVTVNGDVEQWNDARVAFEMSAMIDGDVTLKYGDGGVGTDFGTPISATDDFVRAMGSGLEFGGASNTIEGDLELKFDGESGSTEVFLNVAMSGGTHMSTVEGDLVIEDGGGIRLHGHPGVRTDRNNNPRAHNLSVEGDVFAYEDAMITMEHAAMSTIVGDGLLCSAPGLKFGTKVMLSGDVVFTEGATLTIPTVVIADDVEVEEEGTLMATTVHVTEDGELDSEESVLIEDALVLQGDGLEGSLAAGSTVNNLTYATVDSDEIDLGASVTRLSVNVDMDQELRISEAITVTNLGLCSGTMVLIDTDTEANTLTVTDLLTVMDGHLGLDSNRPGSAGTDMPGPNENRTADHSYILKYVTGGERMAGPEWFGGANAPRKLAVDHADAVIMANEAKSLAEGIHIFKGQLHMMGEDSHLTIGPSGLYDANPAGGPFLVVDTGELHSNGNNVQVHGVVMVSTSVRQVGKIMTGGGELHVLGMTTSKNLDNASAVATLGSVKVGSHPGGVGTIDVGDGALQLGPEAMNPKDGLHGDWQYPIDNADARPHVKLDVIGSSMVTGMIRVPSGSKQTEVIGVNFGAIVFDGTKTPNKNTVNAGNPENWDGTLYVIDADKNVTVDSLGASNGAVEFRGTKATVNKDVAASSVAIYQELKTLDFKGDLAISGTGGFSSRGGDADNRRSLMIGGDYSQETTQTRGGVDMHNPEGGSYLSPNTDKTVMGSFMTSGAGLATRYSTQSGTNLTVKGDFGFGLTAAGYMLNADLAFSGKEAQTVSSAVALGDVLVNNSAGLVLSDSVSQGASSMLTLTTGVISTDNASTWMVKNTGIEEDVRGRNNALTTC